MFSLPFFTVLGLGAILAFMPKTKNSAKVIALFAFVVAAVIDYIAGNTASGNGDLALVALLSLFLFLDYKQNIKKLKK